MGSILNPLSAFTARGHQPQQIFIDLASARSDELIQVPGEFLIAYVASPLDRSGQITVKVDSSQAAGQIVRLGDAILYPFTRLYLTNAAQAGRTITLVVASNNYRFFAGSPGLVPNGTFVFSPADPAVATEFDDNGVSLFAPDGWRPRLFKIRLVTDANPANRLVTFLVTANTRIVHRITAPQPQSASLTVDYFLSIGMEISSDITTSPGNQQMPLPDMTMRGAVRIQTITANIQAGDQFSDPVISAEQW